MTTCHTEEVVPTLTKLDWQSLLDLRIVRKLFEVIEGRWGLRGGYIDGASFTLAHALPCPYRKPADACTHCQDLAKNLQKHLQEQATPTQILRHHEQSLAISSIVAVQSLRIGSLFLGSYSEEHQASPASNVISKREVEFITELLQEAAAEIATYLETEETLLLKTGDENHTPVRYPSLIGSAPAMSELYSLLDKIERSESTVLITGENGTGKELVAKAIHQGSARRDKAFVVQNCSAFNDNLLDSELFGHVRGSFTGANSDKKGLFEVADKGSFFLDEIGEMSPSLQVKVLRVLQEGTFTPVGGTVTKKVDVRIIAATNRDLQAMVESGSFRKDLYYRINVIHVQLPALRDRSEDIELLTDYFLSKHGVKRKQLSSECLATMRGYPWPGNVRELENEVERLMVLAGHSKTLGTEHLSERIQGATPDTLGAFENRDSLPDAVKRLERRMIRDALLQHNGNKTRAAVQLQVSRRNLIRLAQKYQL